MAAKSLSSAITSAARSRPAPSNRGWRWPGRRFRRGRGPRPHRNARTGLRRSERPLIGVGRFGKAAQLIVGRARPISIINVRAINRAREVPALMNISFVASEGVPFSQKPVDWPTSSRRPCLVRSPHSVARSASTCHAISQTKLSDPTTVLRSVTVPFDDGSRFASVVSGGTQGNIKFYFVEYPPYFDRDALYGTPAGDYPRQRRTLCTLFPRRSRRIS